MADSWPFPADDALTRARRIAREYRDQLERLDPQACKQTDALMERLGQAWIIGTLPDEEVLSTADAAAYLAISPRAVRLAVERGRLLVAARDDDGYLFHRSDVIKYLATRRRRVVAESHCSPVQSTASG